MLNKLARERKEALKVEQLRPWDLSVNYLGDKPLKPFQNGEELINKSIECFSMLDPFLGIGNSAVAAKNCGVPRFVGFEIDQKYLTEAKRRIGAQASLPAG